MWIALRYHKIVGEHLAALRRAKGITQVQLARSLKKPQSFVSALESGQRRVDLLEFASIVGASGGDPKVVSLAIFEEIAANLPGKRKRARP